MRKRKGLKSKIMEYMWGRHAPENEHVFFFLAIIDLLMLLSSLHLRFLYTSNTSKWTGKLLLLLLPPSILPPSLDSLLYWCDSPLVYRSLPPTLPPSLVLLLGEGGDEDVVVLQV